MEVVANRYELVEVVGVGAACLVHRGRDRESGATVAVKVYRVDGSVHDRLQQRREMAALTSLRHPGLVTLFDGGTEPGPAGRTYVVTEFVEGGTLAARLVDGPLDPDEVRDLGIRIGSALAHVHEAGIVHRDVKPANVLLADGERPLLADFGIARALDGTVATATGSVAGTAAYLSPEQVRGGEVAAPVDVYALGLVLLECLTGRREYPGTSVESLVARLHRRPRVPAGLPWGLSAVVTAMTADDPAARPDAAAVASALAGASHTTAGPTTERRHRLRWALAGTAAALLVGVPMASAAMLGSGAAPPVGSAGPGASTSVPAPAAPVRPEQVEQVVAVAPAAPVGGGGNPGLSAGSDDPAPARDTGRSDTSSRNTTSAGNGDKDDAGDDEGGDDGGGKAKGNGKGNNGNGKGNGGKGKGKD